jgi:hypothetical protein
MTEDWRLCGGYPTLSVIAGIMRASVKPGPDQAVGYASF